MKLTANPSHGPEGYGYLPPPWPYSLRFNGEPQAGKKVFAVDTEAGVIHRFATHADGSLQLNDARDDVVVETLSGSVELIPLEISR